MKKLLLVLLLLPVWVIAQPTRFEFAYLTTKKGNTEKTIEAKTVMYIDFEKLTIDIYTRSKHHFDILDIQDIEDGYLLYCVDDENAECNIAVGRAGDEIIIVMCYNQYGFCLTYTE